VQYWKRVKESTALFADVAEGDERANAQRAAHSQAASSRITSRNPWENNCERLSPFNLANSFARRSNSFSTVTATTSAPSLPSRGRPPKFFFTFFHRAPSVAVIGFDSALICSLVLLSIS